MSAHTFIPLMSPNITEEDIQSVVNVLKSGMLVQGVNVEALENSFCNYLHSKYSSALSNGTATLHLALKVLGVGPGDEVIVPAFSYIATANVVELVGAKPVFVDIDLRTFNIDNNLISANISPRTKVIMPVHEFGLAADINSIVDLAKNNNLYVIEDAACALGATENGRQVGTFGHFGSFSLHPRKAISSGEGGILVTGDINLDKRVKILRNHGIEISNGNMEFVEAGFNYRMTDFQAALVRSQLTRLEEILSYKNELANIYLNELSGSSLLLPSIPEGKTHSWQTFHVVLPNAIDRNSIITKLRSKGIGTNYGAQCMPFMRVYKEKYSLDSEKLFPNALQAYKQGLALPLYEKLKKEDIKFVAKALLAIM